MTRRATKPTNVASHMQLPRGDINEGFKQADYIVEREFKTAMVHQGYIEPHNAVAIYNSDGRGTIYCSTQGTFHVRSLTAQMLGMPEGNIKVVPAEIGGGFGGKLVVYLEPLALLLSKKTGLPVRMVDVARGGPARDWPDLRRHHPMQNGCDQGWQAGCSRNLDGLRSGGISRLAGRRGRDDDHRALHDSELQDRRLRRRGESPQNRRISRARCD